MPGDRVPLPPADLSVFTARNEMFEGIPMREVESLDIGPGRVCYAPGTELPPVTWAKSRWDVAWGPPLPRTRWGRLKLRMRVRRDRLRDALAVWRGDMEAVPWGEE